MGAEPVGIGKRAGHSSTSVVLDRYGYLMPGLEDKVTDALDQMAAEATQEKRVEPLREVTWLAVDGVAQ